MKKFIIKSVPRSGNNYFSWLIQNNIDQWIEVKNIGVIDHPDWKHSNKIDDSVYTIGLIKNPVETWISQQRSKQRWSNWSDHIQSVYGYSFMTSVVDFCDWYNNFYENLLDKNIKVVCYETLLESPSSILNELFDIELSSVILTKNRVDPDGKVCTEKFTQSNISIDNETLEKIEDSCNFLYFKIRELF